jgi:superfamily II DNA/RNA helicase/cold shock CspA family protein
MQSSFADLGVPARLCATLSRRGITEPFPIQAATLPDALAGRDVAGKAPTGSGKTLAFGLAIAARATASSPGGARGAGRPESRRPRALVLVPTRELAAQVQGELAALIDERAYGPVVAVYGGVGYGPQRTQLARGASAVVACPGRLEDLVARGDVALDRAELVVLDEADRMADMGFLPAVRRLLDRTPANRQTLLFSATLDGDVDTLVSRYQRDPAHHAVAGSDDDCADVDHMFWTVARDRRVELTADVVHRTGPTIVFTRTRHGADRVARQLGHAGVKAVAIHGRRSQSQRDQALRQFRTGRAPALVATDVAARGIHVDGVACVVHFDLPEDPKDYVHRSGRTGRAGATGVVVALVPADGGRRAARTLQRDVGRPEPIGEPDLDRLGPVAAAQRPGRDERREPSGRDGRSERRERHDGNRYDGNRHDGNRSERPERHDGNRYDGNRHDGKRHDGNRSERPERYDGNRYDGKRQDGNRRERRSADDRGQAHRPASARARVESRRDRGVSGTVASFNAAKGYGFISRRGGADVFVHVSALADRDRTLAPGQRVRFELAPGRRGQQATNVRSVA